MKILLDSRLPEALQFCFSPYRADAASSVGLLGKGDEETIRFAEEKGYDFLLMADEGMESGGFEAGRKLSILSIAPPSLAMTDLLPLVGKIRQALSSGLRGQTTIIK